MKVIWPFQVVDVKSCEEFDLLKVSTMPSASLLTQKVGKKVDKNKD